ncbi:uncharacterized protein LOC124286926 [Haliotis rubra]|uniref:uncharacterized protein LOC124286926 n=1 Tax=Haliotis rubra TaxID=36100 RepID=UPI001EE5D1DD|nr:uncharacterized protein LOC124286926 [Haliotis rubra]
MRRTVFYCVCILLEVLVLTYSQTCVTRLEFIPRAITIGKTSNLSITCFGSSILRLHLDSNPIMEIQKFTSSGLVTLATLDGNDNVTKHVEGIDVVGFFPSKFEIVINNPGCSDVTNYFCRVTNFSCMRSRRLVRLVTPNVTQGPPSLTIMPSKPVYEDGELVVFRCSVNVSPRRQFFSWNWDHPLGKDFSGNVKTGQLVDAFRTCNRTSFLALTLKAEDNGTMVTCMTGSSQELKASVVVNVIGRQETITPASPTRPATTGLMQILPDAGASGIPGYLLAVVAVATLILTLIIYSVLLRMGGTKFKFPFTDCFVVKKGHLYEIPDRESDGDPDSSYCVIQNTGPIYINSPRRVVSNAP